MKSEYAVSRNIRRQIKYALKAGIDPDPCFFRSEARPEMLKTNFLLDNAPIGSYGLLDAVLSGAKEIAIVGNKDTETYVDQMRRFTQTDEFQRILTERYNEKGIMPSELELKFINEEKHGTRATTLLQIASAFSQKGSPLYLEVPTDTPIPCTRSFIMDPETRQGYGIMLFLNAKEVAGQFIQRGYHALLQDHANSQLIKDLDGLLEDVREDGLLHVKEMQVMALDQNLIRSNKALSGYVTDGFYSSRKKNLARLKMPLLMITLLAVDTRGSAYSPITWAKSMKKGTKSLFIMGFYGVNQLQQAIRYMQSRGTDDKIDPPIVLSDVAETLIDHVIDYKARSRVKACKYAPLIIDIDGPLDLLLAQQVLEKDKTVYPHHEMMGAFKRFAASEGGWKYELARDWPARINKEIKRFNKIILSYTNEHMISASFDSSGRLEWRQYSAEHIEKYTSFLKRSQERIRSLESKADTP